MHIDQVKLKSEGGPSAPKAPIGSALLWWGQGAMPKSPLGVWGRLGVGHEIDKCITNIC